MFRANIFIKKFIFLFAFNLCKQIKLFAKHIFANKYINTPYYIYSCFVLSSTFLPILMLWKPGALLVVPPPPAGGAACRSSPSSQPLEGNHHQPGKLPAGSVRPGSFPLRVPFWPSFIPSRAYYTPATGKGHTCHSSARRAVSRLNRSCKVRLIDAITLIVNYLDSPLGWLLQVDM